MPDVGASQWPYPNSSAVPDVPADLLLLAQRINLMSSGWTETANATTRAALVTDGDAYEGLKVYQIDTDTTYVYRSSAWAIHSQPVTVFTRTPANLATGTTLLAVDFDTTPLSGSAFTEANGVFTCAIAGTYRVLLSVSFGGNATGNRGVTLVSSTGVNRGKFIAAATSVMQQTLAVPLVIPLAVNDTLTVTARQDSGGNLSTGGEITFERIV